MQRRPTLEDVAAHAGVSRALVSIVIRDAPGASDATRQRVLAAADELGYRPDARARMLGRARTRLIGVSFGVAHAFHGDLVDGLYVAARAAGYELALSAVTARRDEREALAGLQQDRCEALVLLGPGLPTRELAAAARHLPVVVVARAVRDRTVDVVRTGDAEGVGLAVDHLATLGHRRIVHVDGGTAPGAAERRRGFADSVAAQGIGAGSRVVPGGPTEDDGAAAARVLLDGPALPTAVVAFNDRCATGLLDRFRRAGVEVPRDLSLVGYDDSRLARLSHVDLTTVAQDVDRIATLTVERVAARLEGGDVGRREVVLAPRLVVRGTTAPPPEPISSH